MISKALAVLAEDLGLKVDDSCAFGEYSDYMLTIYEKGNRRIAFISYYLKDNEDDALKKFRVSESVKADISEHGIKEFEIEDNGLTVELIGNISDFADYIDILIDKLKSEEIEGMSACSECGKALEGNYKTVSLNQNRYVLCDSCTLELIQNSSKAASEKAKEDTSGSLGLGLLGSFIGMLFGAVLWNFVASFGIVSMWMAFLLALLSFLGYIVFKGKNGKTKIIVVSIMSFIGVLLCSYTSEIISYLKINEISYSKFMIAPMSFIEVAMNSDTFNYAITFIIALLCAAFSILIFATDLLKDKPKPETIKFD